LYFPTQKAIATDIESKLSESSILNSLLSDYRNFAHGRHTWIDKKNNTLILALSDSINKELAESTLKKLPKHIPVVRLHSDLDGSNANIDLLMKSFHLINQIGEIIGIDPGNPGVSEFGRELYIMDFEDLLPTDE
jgi:hypothetical protein